MIGRKRPTGDFHRWWSDPTRHADIEALPDPPGAAVTRAASGPGSRSRGLSRSKPAILQVSPGNETHLHAPRTELTRVRWRTGDAIPANLARICLQEASGCRGSGGFSSSRGCFATASAAICICRSSRCWNGTAPMPTYDAVMADSIVVIAHAAQATGIGRFSFRGRSADPFAEPELLTVAAAFERFAGIDLLATVSDGEGDRAALAAAAAGTGADLGGRHLVGYFQQGSGRACRTKSGAGAFDDAVRISGSRGCAGADQTVRSARCRAFRGLCLRRRTGQRVWRIDGREGAAPALQRWPWTKSSGATANAIRSTRTFLMPSAQMPQASGVALGFDRLVMLASGACGSIRWCGRRRRMTA